MDMDGEEVEDERGGEEGETHDLPFGPAEKDDEARTRQGEDEDNSYKGTLRKRQKGGPLEDPFRAEPEGSHLQLVESTVQREYSPKDNTHFS